MRTANGSTDGSGKYRKVLLGKRAKLLAGLCGELDTVAAEGSLEDLGPLLHDHSIALQVNQLDCLQLRLIEAALVRMDSEKYGVLSELWQCHLPQASRSDSMGRPLYRLPRAFQRRFLCRLIQTIDRARRPLIA